MTKVFKLQCGTVCSRSRDDTDPVLFLIDIMICSYCAAPMPDISGFCPQCGQAVRAASDTSRRNAEFGLPGRQALLGTLAYVTALPALLFLAIPTLRRDSFVRFHCWQSIFFAI